MPTSSKGEQVHSYMHWSAFVTRCRSLLWASTIAAELLHVACCPILASSVFELSGCSGFSGSGSVAFMHTLFLTDLRRSVSSICFARFSSSRSRCAMTPVIHVSNHTFKHMSKHACTQMSENISCAHACSRRQAAVSSPCLFIRACVHCVHALRACAHCVCACIACIACMACVRALRALRALRAWHVCVHCVHLWCVRACVRACVHCVCIACIACVTDCDFVRDCQ